MEDRRQITTGAAIPVAGYCDQPYVVVTAEGDWLCVMTTGPGVEGDRRQHIIAIRSADHGQTWSEPVDIEPLGPPEASWVMPLIVPSGRVYAFYVYNGDHLDSVPAGDGGLITRMDTLGHYCFKYSDDGGRSWSAERFRIPLREMAIDHANTTGGAVQFFWGVGKPVIHTTLGAVFFGAAKVGDFVSDGFMASSEGIFLRSDNILTEPDPAAIRWAMLPDGDNGLRAPLGPVADEHNPCVLADGSLYCTYRTVAGHPAHAYSRDGGHTWTPPAFMTYTPGGRLVKHPRAANFVRRLADGRFIYWFHNHGGKYYMDRNPVWLCGGVERDGFLHWSQPEIILYDDEPSTRMSYPDFIEQDGRLWITETQKTVARVHEIDPGLLAGLWQGAENAAVTSAGLVLDLHGTDCAPGATTPLPTLPNPATRGGFTLDLWLTPAESDAEQIIFDTRNRYGRGITLALEPHGALRLTLGDRRDEFLWESDPGLLHAGQRHHVAAIIDGGPKIVTFVINGLLCDGGTARPKGWGRFPHRLDDLNGRPSLQIDPALIAQLHHLRLYDRALRTAEAIGNFRAGTGVE